MPPKKNAKTEKVEEPVVRQTVVTRNISRTLQTAKYFSLVITGGAQDTIEWSTLKERQEKMDNLTTLAIEDFRKEHDRVLNELQLAEVHAFAKDAVKEANESKSIEDLGIDDFDVLE